MFLALLNPHLALILVSLAVAAYMFAAIKFPALRFIFRLKGFAARGLGVDEDGNRSLGENLGAFLCPLIGIGALAFAGYSAMDWKKSNASKAQLKVDQAARQQALIDETKEMLANAEIDQLYFDTRPRAGVTEQGRKQVEGFLRELGSRLGSDALDTPPQGAGFTSDGLLVTFKPVAGMSARRQLSIFPERDGIGVWNRLATGVLVKIPADLQEAWRALGSLERTDLQAIEREQNRIKSEEYERLSNYPEKTFAGPASWEIYDAVTAVATELQDAKKKEFIGTKIDWECEFIHAKNKIGKVLASQSRPGGAGSTFSILFEADPSQLPQKDGMSFARIRGTIESMDKGIGVKVDQLELFTP